MKIKYDIKHNKTVGANVYFNANEFILFYKILSDFVHPKLPDTTDLKLGKEMYDGILTPEEYKQEELKRGGTHLIRKEETNET